MINNIKIEICIGNIDDALKADQYPIDRIELNSSLELGGITPSLETLIYLKKHIKAKICCMIRPRGGDFVFTDLEFETMLLDAKRFLENGTDGIVFGCLKDGFIDVERTIRMCDLVHSYDKEVVFHKAFDEVKDLNKAIETLIECGVDRILTSGGQSDILKGCDKLAELNDKYGDKIQILPGGGVRTNNIQQIISNSHSKQIHMTSKRNNPGGYVEFEPSQLEEIIEKIKEL